MASASYVSLGVEEVQYAFLTANALAVGTNEGFRIYSTNPFDQLVRRDMGGSVGIVTLYRSSNYMLLVGGSGKPFAPTSSLVLWDEAIGARQATLSLSAPVRAARMCREAIVVVLDYEVHIFSMHDLTLLRTERLYGGNPLLDVSTINSGGTASAVWAGKDNNVTIGRIRNAEHSLVSVTTKAPTSCLCVSANGDFGAFVSEDGTTIEVWKLTVPMLHVVLMRGAQHAQVHSVAISSDNQFLASTSSNGTVHLFKIPAEPTKGLAGAGGQRAANSAYKDPAEENLATKGVQQGGKPGGGKGALYSWLVGTVTTTFQAARKKTHCKMGQASLVEGSGHAVVAFGKKRGTLLLTFMGSGQSWGRLTFQRIVFDPSSPPDGKAVLDFQEMYNVGDEAL